MLNQNAGKICTVVFSVEKWRHSNLANFAYTRLRYSNRTATNSIR